MCPSRLRTVTPLTAYASLSTRVSRWKKSRSWAKDVFIRKTRTQETKKAKNGKKYGM